MQSGSIDQLPKPTRRAASTEDWPWEGVEDPTTTQTRLPCGQETSPSPTLAAPSGCGAACIPRH